MVAASGASLSNPELAPRAVIFGCAGLTLAREERDFFAATRPLGFILFARNVDSPAQVRDLVGQLRDSVGRADAPVLIDQEGGRVQRLRPPHWRAAPPGARFGELAERNPEAAVRAARLNARLIASELADLGITVDCAPVADVPVPGAHDVIGDRAYGTTVARVVPLARATAQGLLDGGVLPIVKHVPGHGRARADSHKELPVVEASHAVLSATDFAAFKALNDLPWAMTAHVRYDDIDAAAPASTSPRVIRDIVRGEIGFDGVLVCDDLSMKALGGTFAERATATLAAGCDVVLHCSGTLAEMHEIAAVVPPLSSAAAARVARAEALRQRSGAGPFDVAEAGRELARLLAGVV
jgi:beta-N-acetylhexosaminidase